MQTKPAKPVIGIRQLIPVLVVDAVFVVAIVAVILGDVAHRPYVGSLTLLQTLLLAFGLVSLAVLHFTVMRPLMREQAARRAAARLPERTFLESLKEPRASPDDPEYSGRRERAD